MKFANRTLFSVCLISFCALSQSDARAININDQSAKGLGRAHGFLMGQEFSLSRIAAEMPDLAYKVTVANTQFSSTFPKIKEKLDHELLKAYGEKAYEKYIVEAQNKMRQVAESQPLSRNLSIDFIQQVQARAKGKLEPQILNYLLAVQYQTNPAGEIADGFVQRYETDGSGKAKGVQLSLKLPLSWVGKEGERPHTLQGWTSEGGTGMEFVSLQIRDVQGAPLTKAEIEESVRSGDLRTTLPAGATYIGSGNINIEKQPGYWLQFGLNSQRGELSLYQNLLQYNIFLNNKSIILGCSAGAEVNEKVKADIAATRIRPLCQRILNSLVFPQVYK